MEEKIEFYKETEFKDTEIGKIPKEWEVVKLGSIAKILSGNTAPQEEKYFKNGRNPFVRVQHLKRLQEGKFPVNYDFINDYALSELKLKLFKKGCIIFPKSGESIKLEKRAMLKEDSYVVNHLAVIEPIYGSVDNLFLFYYLRKIKTSDYLTETTTPSLKLLTISNFLVPLPPLIEQQKIAEILSNIDEAIQKTDDIIAKTERLKKGLMQELLTKGIGHKEFKDTEIGRIPKEWEVVELGKISNILMGQSPPGKTYNNDGKGIPFLQGKAEFGPFYPRHIKFTTSPLKIAESGSILISVRAPVGDVNIANINYCIGRGLASISVRKGSNIFLFYLLKYFKQIIEKEGTGSTFKAINKNRLENVKIPWPSLEEQQKIASILSTVDEKLENLKQERTKLERIKQWFMGELLTGKIRVRVA